MLSQADSAVCLTRPRPFVTSQSTANVSLGRICDTRLLVAIMAEQGLLLLLSVDVEPLRRVGCFGTQRQMGVGGQPSAINGVMLRQLLIVQRAPLRLPGFERHGRETRCIY